MLRENYVQTGNWMVIGFATQYHTLWNIVVTRVKNQYGVDVEHVSYNYIKNISKSWDKTREKYPNLAFDSTLRGMTQSWEATRYILDGANTQIPFGKYAGQTIQEVSLDDPDYLMWIIQKSTCNADFKNVIRELPVISTILEKQRQEYEEKKTSFFLSADTQEITVSFERNLKWQGYIDQKELIGGKALIKRYHFQDYTQRHYNGYEYAVPKGIRSLKNKEFKLEVKVDEPYQYEDNVLLQQITVTKLHK